jgi:hypothetical protein
MRDCRKYIDAVKICFSGVKDLICALPPNIQNDEEESNGSPRLKNMKQLNFDIHGNWFLTFCLCYLNNFKQFTIRKASELEVVGLLVSDGKEHLNFFTSLKSYSLQRVSEWFENLLKLMKSSMSKHAQTYLDKLDVYQGTF